MKTSLARDAVLVALIPLLISGCNAPSLGSTTQGLDYTDDQALGREWEGKGFGFTWDEATPDTAASESPLRFSGVAYGCTITTFYAHVELTGPMSYVSEYQSMNSRGSGSMMETSDHVPLLVSGKMQYDVNIPMTGAALFRGGFCDVTYPIEFHVAVDLKNGTADITSAVMGEGVWTCTTDEGYTASVPFPALPLPMPKGITIQVLDTEECLRDLEGTK